MEFSRYNTPSAPCFKNFAGGSEALRAPQVQPIVQCHNYRPNVLHCQTSLFCFIQIGSAGGALGSAVGHERRRGGCKAAHDGGAYDGSAGAHQKRIDGDGHDGDPGAVPPPEQPCSEVAEQAGEDGDIEA